MLDTLHFKPCYFLRELRVELWFGWLNEQISHLLSAFLSRLLVTVGLLQPVRYFSSKMRDWSLNKRLKCQNKAPDKDKNGFSSVLTLVDILCAVITQREGRSSTEFRGH